MPLLAALLLASAIKVARHREESRGFAGPPTGGSSDHDSPSPLEADQMTKRHEGPEPGQQTSGTLLGKGPFTEGLVHSPPSSWISVVLMVVGFSLLGVAGVVLAFSVPTALVVGAVGVTIGLVGIVVGVRQKLMSSVE